MTDDAAGLTVKARVGVLFAALVIAFAGVLVVARDSPGDSDEPQGLPGLGREGKYPVMEHLELTTAQREAWIGHWRTFEHRVRPALDQVAEVRVRLRAELTSASPDPATVGGYVITLRDLAANIASALDHLDIELDEILDDGQRTRYKALKAANRAARQGRGVLTTLTNSFPALEDSP